MMKEFIDTIIRGTSRASVPLIRQSKFVSRASVPLIRQSKFVSRASVALIRQPKFVSRASVAHLKSLTTAILLVFGFTIHSQAQTTVNFTADSTMGDAMVINGSNNQTNFGSQNQINVYHQVGQQIPVVNRTFIEYDISSIPADAIVTDATLKLVTRQVNNAINHPIYIERASESWAEGTVTWNNQPDVITADQLSFTHAQTSGTGTHQFDVTEHVQQMVNNPSMNNGWRIRLQSESDTADFGIIYHSSEANNTGKRPVLTVEYVMPIELSATVTHCTAGNDDGEFSVDISGGSGYTLTNMYLYKTVRDTTQRGTASLTNYKTTGNLQYNSGTGKITAENLEPGVYMLRVLDDEYSTNNDLRLAFYKHILVGREGETTNGILMPNYKYQDNTTIQYDKPTNSNPLDRANTNYHSDASLIHLRVADAPNNYEFASLMKYRMDFDDQLQFTKAELQMNAYSQFYRGSSSSNAVNVSLVTENWEESSVTWNTRPAIDSSLTVYIPTTTTIGYENTHDYDTINMMPFVDHWLANPDDNFGFELALETYGATQYAQRSYKSASSNHNFIEFDFTVRQPVVAEWDEETNTGNITVNAPSTGDLPYKYLISYNAIPSLANLWAAVGDSIPVDSSTFFQGDTQSKIYQFENLDAERYYIAVFDNNGTKILEKKVILSPEFQLINDTNMDLTDGVLKRGVNASNGTTQINGLITEDQNGGFEFAVTELGGNMVLGLHDFAASVPATTTDFEYCFEFFADTSFKVYTSGDSLFTGTIAQDDIFRVVKQNNEIIWYQNRYELARQTIQVADRANLTGAGIFRTPLGAIDSGVKLDHFKPTIRPLTTIPLNKECGDQGGNVRAAYSAPAYYGGTGTYSIVNRATELVVASGPVSDLLTGEVALLGGDYKITYNYTVGGVTYIYNTYFSIGFEIFWNLLNENIVAVDGTVNTIEASGSLDNGLAMSQNNLGYPLTGWAYVHVNPVRYYVPFGDPIPFAPSRSEISFVNQDIMEQVMVNVYGIGDGILNKYIWADGYGIDGFSTPLDGPIQIERKKIGGVADAWDYEISFNGGSPFTTVLDPEAIETSQTFNVFVTTRNSEIYESYASFCGFETIRSYADLTKKLDGGYYLAQNGIVKFIYNEEYHDQDGQLTYSVFDATNTEVVSHLVLAQTVVYGDNRYDLDFSSFTGDEVLSNGVYVLRVTNEKDEYWYLRFKITNN